MELNKQIDVLMVKAREHKAMYSENIEDIRMGYLDALLQQNGLSTHIIDFAFCVSPFETDGIVLTEFVNINRPRLIIFIVDKHPTNGPAYTMELLDNLTSSSVDFSSMHITLYGNTHIDYLSFFKHQVNSVILGEEYSALSLVQSVLDDSFPVNVHGVAYQDDTSAVVSRQAKLFHALDDLPFPTRYALPEIKHSQYAASILSSRGCFGKCSYCYLRSKDKYFSGYAWRSRSTKSVVDEIEKLYQQGVTEFFFADDEFLPKGEVGVARAFELSNEIKERNLSIHYSIYSRTDCLTEEIVRELNSSGLYCVFLGVESFSQDVLNRYNKGLTVEDNLKAITLLKKYNIHIRLGLILFDTNTTMKELSESIDALKIISSANPELLFQSMFFSNVLIPLADTPSEAYINPEKQITSNLEVLNVMLQENYMRRSRSGNLVNKFYNPMINKIYTCVEIMSQQLLSKCIEEENHFYTSGYQMNSMEWFNQITKFAITQLSLIYESVAKNSTVEECNKIVKRNIDMFCLKFVS